MDEDVLYMQVIGLRIEDVKVFTLIHDLAEQRKAVYNRMSTVPYRVLKCFYLIHTFIHSYSVTLTTSSCLIESYALITKRQLLSLFRHFMHTFINAQIF